MSASHTLKFIESEYNLEPWLGLASYPESAKDIFFGRESETDSLIRLLGRQVLTIVFGASGSGKTSILNAGVFPRLRDTYYLPIPVRLDYANSEASLSEQALAAVAQVVKDQGIEEEFRAESVTGAAGSLWDYFHRVDLWDRRNNALTPVLTFDQFEEIFTLGGNQESMEAFVEDLAAVVEGYVPALVRSRLEKSLARSALPSSSQNYRIILALREDFVSRLDGLRNKMPSVMHNRFVLSQMDGVQALRPVLLPASALVSEDVATKIVRKVASVNRIDTDPSADSISLAHLAVEPTLLSLMCSELNRLRIRAGKDKITEDLVDSAAGDILNDFYERCFYDIGPRVRIFVEDHLLTTEGFRTTAALDSAISAGIGGDISRLVNRRLLRQEERFGIPHIELTHDVLTKVARKSRDERHSRESLENERRETIRRELERKQASTRAQQRLILVSSIAIALILGTFAYISFLHARKDQKYALDARNDGIAKRLAIQVQALQATSRDDNLSYLMLKTASSINPDEPLLGQAIFSVVSQPYSVHALPTGLQQLSDVKWSPNGRMVAAVGTGEYVFISEGENGHVQRAPCNSHLCTAVAWSPDARMIAFGEDDGYVNVWDFQAARFILRKRSHRSTVNAIAWNSPTEFASAGLDGNVLLWDLTRKDEMPERLPRVARSIHALAFSRDGLLAIGGFRALRIWNTVQKIRVFDSTDNNIVSSVAWSPHGDLAVGSWSGRVQVLDSGYHNRMRYDLPSLARVWALTWLGTDSLAIGSGDQKITIKKIDSEDDQALATLNAVGGTPRALSTLPESRQFAQIADDEYIRVWAESPQPPILTSDFQESTITSLQWSENGQVILSGASDGRVLIWNGSNFENMSHEALGGPLMPINDLTSVDGEASVVLGIGGAISNPEKRGGLTAWRPGSRRRKLSRIEWSYPRQSLTFPPKLSSMALSPQKTAVALGSEIGQVILLTGHDDQWRNHGAPVQLGKEPIRLLTWRDESSVIAIDRRGKAYVVQASSGKVVIEGKQPLTCDPKRSIASTPSADLVAMDCRNEIRISQGSIPSANSRSDVPLKIVSDVSLMKWSPNGRWLAYGFTDGGVGIFDSHQPGTRYYTIPAHTGAVTALAWSVDGKKLASGGSDAKVHVWTLPYPFQVDLCKAVTRPMEPAEWQRYIGPDLPFVQPCPTPNVN